METYKVDETGSIAVVGSKASQVEIVGVELIEVTKDDHDEAVKLIVEQDEAEKGD